MNKQNFIICLILSVFLFSTSALAISEKTYVKDNLVDTTIAKKQLEIPEMNLNYNYQGTSSVPIRLTITKEIRSEDELIEGEDVYFKVVSDVFFKGECVVKRGTIVPAKVETIITSGMNGIPASIIFGSFKFEEIKNSQLTDTVEIFGQDRTFWVYPLKWALTFLPPTGSLTNLIKGGHAKLGTEKVIKIYYHPDWA